MSIPHLGCTLLICVYDQILVPSYYHKATLFSTVSILHSLFMRKACLISDCTQASSVASYTQAPGDVFISVHTFNLTSLHSPAYN